MNFARDRLSRLHEVFEANVSRREVPGVVALLQRRGETHVEAVGSMAFGGKPMQRETIFRIASMTKPVIAVATSMPRSDGHRAHPARVLLAAADQDLRRLLDAGLRGARRLNAALAD